MLILFGLFRWLWLIVQRHPNEGESEIGSDMPVWLAVVLFSAAMAILVYGLVA